MSHLVHFLSILSRRKENADIFFSVVLSLQLTFVNAQL